MGSGSSALYNDKFCSVETTFSFLNFDYYDCDIYDVVIEWVVVDENGYIKWDVYDSKEINKSIKLGYYGKTFLQFLLEYIMSSDSDKGRELDVMLSICNISTDTIKKIDKEVLDSYIVFCVESKHWGYIGEKRYVLLEHRELSLMNNIRLFEQAQINPDVIGESYNKDIIRHINSSKS